jgi:hypothetical protein
MNKSFKKGFLLSTVAILGLPLVACGPTNKSSESSNNSASTSTSTTKSSSESNAVVAIRVYGKLAAVKYYQGATVDYSQLQIQTLTSSNKVLETILYSQNPSKFTYTQIDTSAVATGKVFTVTYKANDTTASLSANVIYDVLINDLTPIGWHANKRWTDFTSQVPDNTKVNADGTHPSSFMKSTSYYIGNKNSLDLFPIVNGKDHFGNVSTMSSVSSGITVALKDSTDATLTLSDYFNEADITNLQTKGVVDFKDDKTGTFTLAFTYPSGAATAFPEIDYKLVVVDGYNVTNAKQLAVMNNTTDATIKSINDPWKSANGIPTDVQVNNVVIQNDLTINKADLPDYAVWGASTLDTAPNDASCKGTLKDYKWIYEHFLDKDHPTFNLYGNLFKISCGDDFPYVEENTNQNGTHLGESETVNSHTAVFGSNKFSDYDSATDKSIFKFNIQDLAFTGKTGVTTDTSMKSKGGVIFIKPNSDSLIKNCVLSTIFLGTVNDGVYNSATDYKYYTNTWDSTRIHDTFSAQIFNYLYGDVEIKNCDLYKAGGPLVINQCPSISLAGLSSADAALIKGSWIKIDADTSLDNYVSGTGGWFDIYEGASNYVAQLKQLDPLMKAAVSKTFLNSESKLNFISLNMSTGETISGTKSGGLFGGTTIGTKSPIDYNGGRDAMLAAVANAATDPATYMSDLYSTDTGALFVSQAKATSVCPPVFKLNNDFAMPTVDTTGAVNGMANVKYYVTNQDADKALSADAKNASYLGIYGFGGFQNLDPSNPANYMSWTGSNDFGLVVALSAA